MKKVVTIIVSLIAIGGILLGVFLYKKNNSGTAIENDDNKVESYYKKEEMYLSKKNTDDNLATYLKYEGTNYQRITEAEAKKILNTYTYTCGLKDMESYSFENEKDGCIDSVGDEYIMYLKDGIPYYMHVSTTCENDECNDDYVYYDIVEFSFIKNVKQIVSMVNQYAGGEFGPTFAFELENGEVYYFTPLYDSKTIDGVEKNAHIVKVNMPSELNKFSNIENGQITYGTDIVLELKNKEKYVLKYSYETNKISLLKYDEYVDKYSSDNDDKETNDGVINVDLKIEEKEYIYDLSDIIVELNKKNKSMETGSKKDLDYALLKIENDKVIYETYCEDINTNKPKTTKFVINNIKNPVGVFGGALGGEDGFPVKLYVLDSSNNIYNVNFCARAYDDCIKSIDKINYITPDKLTKYIVKEGKITDLPDIEPIQSKENFEELFKRNTATCGLTGLDEKCGYMGTDKYVAYIYDGIAYLGRPALFCGEDDECETDDDAYEVLTLSDIKNVKAINIDYNQYYDGVVYFATKDGSLYYFISIDHEKYSLIKVNTSYKFKRFVLNDELSDETFGTKTVFELSDNNKYTIDYDYNKKLITINKWLP